VGYCKMRNFMTTVFVFKGRIGRRRYWSLTLLYGFALVLGTAAFVATGILLDAKTTDPLTFVLYYAAPSWLLKSAGPDGAGLFFLAATLGVAIWAVVDLGMLRGEAGNNAFAPSPLRPADGFVGAVPAEI
jgi:uncharacterized membrane protein YhaH (DUF805 family)